jgi:hypothetical protein
VEKTKNGQLYSRCHVQSPLIFEDLKLITTPSLHNRTLSVNPVAIGGEIGERVKQNQSAKVCMS